jgi:hypothetical protein
MKVWPEGYLKEELEFTRVEFESFMNYDGWSIEEKERLRLDLLTKREIFKKYWEVKNGND